MKCTNFRPAGCYAYRKLYLVSKVTLGRNNFSVVWIENLSNISTNLAMSNNRITADYEFFAIWQLSLQLVRAVGDLLTGLIIHRERVKLATDLFLSWPKVLNLVTVLATDLCLSWPKVLNLVTVRGLMKTLV